MRAGGKRCGRRLSLAGRHGARAQAESSASAWQRDSAPRQIQDATHQRVRMNLEL